MATTPDYAKLTVDELLAQEAKIKKQRILWSFILGVFIGILFWVVMLHTSMVKLVLLVVLFSGLGSGGRQNEDNFKAIKSELRSRNLR